MEVGGDGRTGGQTSEVRFPQGRARFATGILRIALAQRCPIVPVTVTRRADLKYRVEAFEPFYIERRGSLDETLTHYAQRLADIFVPVIPPSPRTMVPIRSPFRRGVRACAIAAGLLLVLAGGSGLAGADDVRLSTAENALAAGAI